MLFKEQPDRKESTKKDGFHPLEYLSDKFGKRKLAYILLALAIQFVLGITYFRYLEQEDLLDQKPKEFPFVDDLEYMATIAAERAYWDSIEAVEGHPCYLAHGSPREVNFKGIKVRYSYGDSCTHITYEHNGKEHYFDSIACSMSYAPGMPRPSWRNEKYLGFHSGCGTSCWCNQVVKLDGSDSIIPAGDQLIDTARVIFVTPYRLHDGSPVMEFLYLDEERKLTQVLSSEDYYGAIFWDDLDYSKDHPDGFTAENNRITFYYEDGRTKTLPY